MKNLLKYGFIALVICFSSCVKGGETKTSEKKDFNTIIIEGCEYIYFPYYSEKSMVHKGNCNNPIHNCR